MVDGAEGATQSVVIDRPEWPQFRYSTAETTASGRRGIRCGVALGTSIVYKAVDRASGQSAASRSAYVLLIYRLRYNLSTWKAAESTIRPDNPEINKMPG